MKRLVKQSELYKSYLDKNDNEYVEIFKNPTFKEIKDIQKLSCGIRGLLYKNGDLYVWPGAYLHDYMPASYLELDMKQYHMTVEHDTYIRFDCDHSQVYYDEFKNALEKNLVFIGQMVDIQNSKLVVKDLDRQNILLNQYTQETTFDRLLHPEKELIKESEIYNSFNINQSYYEVFKNPTEKEIDIVKNQNMWGAVRGIILDSGEIYIWSGVIIHESIKKYIDINIDEFRFAYESEWLIDAHEKYTIKEICKLIVKYENILQKIGLVSHRDFNIFFTKDEGTKTLNISEIKQTANRLSVNGRT